VAMGTLCTVYPYGYMGRCVGIGRRASALCADTARACASRALRRVYIYIYTHTHTHSRYARSFVNTPVRDGSIFGADAVAVEPRVGARGVGAHREDAARCGAVRERGAR